MNSEDKGFLARQLTALSTHCYKNPRSTLAICLALVVASLVLAATNLTLEMDWTYLFEEDDPVVKRVEVGRDLFPIGGDIAVMVDHGTPDQRHQFLISLAERLEREPDVFYHVFYRVDLEPLVSKALYYLSEDSLRDLAASLKGLSENSKRGVLPTSGTGKKIILKLLYDLEVALVTRGRADYEPVWQFLSNDENQQTIHHLEMLLDGEHYLYPTVGGGQVNVLLFHTGPWGTINPPQTKAVNRVREIIAEMTPTVGDIRIRLTGLPVMLHDERDTVSHDGIRSASLSIVLILIVFAIGFGEFSRPLLAVTALSCGLAWSMGYTTLAVGHLNFITVSLVTMLMGLGIDFGIHLLFRYDEELGKGRTPLEAIDHTLSGTGVDTFIGAVATSVAFLALTGANFRGIADFGVIAAGGVMLIFLSTITVLPALLAVYPGTSRPPINPDGFLAWGERFLLRNARKISIAGILFLFLCANWATHVGFNYNLLEIQDPEIDSVHTEIEMVTDLQRSVLSGQSLVKGEKAARERIEKFKSLPAVSDVGSVLSALPEVSVKQQFLIEEIVELIPRLELPEKVQLEDAADLLALRKRFEGFEQSTTEIRDLEIAEGIQRLRTTIAGMEPGPIQDALIVFQNNVYSDLSGLLNLLKKQSTVPPNLDDLPASLVLRDVNPDGYYKLSVSAKKNIWEKENLETFLEQTRTVDPELIGHPVVQIHILQAFDRAFQRTPWYTLAGVLLVMAIYLRRPQSLILSLLPTATGVLIIFAAMGLTGIDFNVVNFVALPMSVGIGAVYGVHALHRMWELQDETIMTSSTGPALILSGLTTLIGFATLMLSNHRGMASLGFVISVGVAVNFGGSLIFLPAMRRALRLKDGS